MSDPAAAAPIQEAPPADNRYLSRTAHAVERQVFALQDGYLKDSAWAVATLAKLRRAAGSTPGSDFGAWEVVAATISDDLNDGTAQPSRAENAAHTALTLYALHQQSKQEAMHVPRRSIGGAVRLLAKTQGDEDGESLPPVLRRFHALGTAEEFSEIVHHARALISQLRATSIGLDYALLTQHLIALQDPHRAARVRLGWGRDYYRTPSTPESAGTTDIDPTTSGDPS